MESDKAKPASQREAEHPRGAPARGTPAAVAVKTEPGVPEGLGLLEVRSEADGELSLVGLPPAPSRVYSPPRTPPPVCAQPTDAGSLIELDADIDPRRAATFPSMRRGAEKNPPTPTSGVERLVVPEKLQQRISRFTTQPVPRPRLFWAGIAVSGLFVGSVVGLLFAKAAPRQAIELNRATGAVPLESIQPRPTSELHEAKPPRVEPRAPTAIPTQESLTEKGPTEKSPTQEIRSQKALQRAQNVNAKVPVPHQPLQADSAPAPTVSAQAVRLEGSGRKVPYSKDPNSEQQAAEASKPPSEPERELWLE